MPDNDPVAMPLVSPTGTPLIPPKFVPFVLAGSAIVVIAEDVEQGGHWDAARVARLVVKLIPTLLAGAVPGLRFGR